MPVRTMFLPLAYVAALAGQAYAADTERYTLQKTEDGYVRLDTQTGEMALCKEEGTQLVCRIADDERKALQGRIDGLETKLADIEGRLAAIENSPIMKSGELLPSEEQFDKSLDAMEKFFRRFMEVMRDVEKDSERI